MKTLFLCFTVFCLNSWVTELNYYEKALPLVLNSKEFKEYKISRKDYFVSTEIISFQNFEMLFKDELRTTTLYDLNIPDVVKTENELTKLNFRKCGKAKVFFSEQKNDIFFAEVFQYRKQDIKYNTRPMFGISYIYMFKINDEKQVSLVKVLEVHNN